jgi:hypothetical protein
LHSQVEVSINGAAVSAHINKRIDILQVALDAQIAADCNLFCPQDQGDLQASALMWAKHEHGMLVWERVYASRLYYNPQFNFSKDMNPRACGKWCEVAKTRYIKRWESIVDQK